MSSNSKKRFSDAQINVSEKTKDSLPNLSDTKQPLIITTIGDNPKKFDFKLAALQLLMFGITFMNYAALHATRSIWSSATKDFIREF